MGFSTVSSLALQVATIVGLWKVFEKSGVEGFWAIIPFAREYHLGICAERKDDAVKQIVFALISGAALTVTLISFIVLLAAEVESKGDLAAGGIILCGIMLFVSCVAGIASLVFMIKVYMGLCDVYDQSRWWVLLWVFLQWVAALIWGFSESFEPVMETGTLDGNTYGDTYGNGMTGGTGKAEDADYVPYEEYGEPDREENSDGIG